MRGVQWYFENEPEIYKQDLEILLTDKWKTKNEDKPLRLWFQEVAHKIRCKQSNERRNPVNNTRRSFHNIEGKGLKLWPTHELADQRKLQLIQNAI